MTVFEYCQVEYIDYGLECDFAKVTVQCGSQEIYSKSLFDVLWKLSKDGWKRFGYDNSDGAKHVIFFKRAKTREQ